MVATSYPGASPKLVEQEVTEPIEEAVNTVGGVKKLSSRSYPSRSIVIAEFQLDVDPVQAAQSIREKIAAVRDQFPSTVANPLVNRLDPNALPIMTIGVKADQTRSLSELTRLTKDYIKPFLSQVSGVGEINIIGGINPRIIIEPLPEKLLSYRITPIQLIGMIRAENQLVPVGGVYEGLKSWTVEIDGQLKTPEALAELVLFEKAGSFVRLKDVAVVRYGPQEREDLALVNGQPSIALEIVTVQDANVVQTADQIVKVLKKSDLKNRLPSDVSLEVLRDQSSVVRASVHHLQQSLIEGAILTILIIFLFLGSWRSTVITGLSLPISIMGSFVIIYALGFSLNFLTLLALSLSVGILVDDAIVVRENIVRHMRLGKSYREAAISGTEEIGLAVLATTFTIIVVFLPVGFMGGLIGRFFKQFGLTVAFAVFLSMCISFTLDPMLSSLWSDPDVEKGAEANYEGKFFGKILNAIFVMQEKLSSFYVSVLQLGLQNRLWVIAIAVTSFLVALGLARFVGSDFVPKGDYDEMVVSMDTPLGSTLDFTALKVRQVEQELKKHPEILSILATINSGLGSSPSKASLFIKLTPRKNRKRSIEQLAAVLRPQLLTIAGVTVRSIGVPDAIQGKKPIEVNILGKDNTILKDLAQKLTSQFKQKQGIVDIEDSSADSLPAISLIVNRQRAADLGLSMSMLSATLQAVFNDTLVMNQTDDIGNSYDVVLQLANNKRDFERLLTLHIPTVSGSWIPLKEVVQVEKRDSLSQILRNRMTHVVTVSANLSGISLGEIAQVVQGCIDSIEVPSGYQITMGGERDDMLESFGYAMQALLLAVIFIYIILASQFRSFIHPITIMCSLPLSFLGVVLALLLFQQRFSLFAMIGVIMLMGLVTKNAILLIDFVNQAIWAGVPRNQAILSAGQIRLRPILMTTLSIICGMLPLIWGVGDGNEVRAPMAYAVIGGVTCSFFLTLIVVPIVYTYFDDFSIFIKKRFFQNTSR